jgi:hypothetical protein
MIILNNRAVLHRPLSETHLISCRVTVTLFCKCSSICGHDCASIVMLPLFARVKCCLLWFQPADA